MITNQHIFHRQLLRKKDPRFVLKTKYRRDDLDEKKYGYDENAHREAVKKMNPMEYLEKS
jgi:hypothetical protein